MPARLMPCTARKPRSKTIVSAPVSTTTQLWRRRSRSEAVPVPTTVTFTSVVFSSSLSAVGEGGASVSALRCGFGATPFKHLAYLICLRDPGCRHWILLLAALSVFSVLFSRLRKASPSSFSSNRLLRSLRSECGPRLSQGRGVYLLTAPEQVTQLPSIETVEAAALRAGIRQPISKPRSSDRGLTHALSSQWLARLGERARDRYFTIHHIGADLEAVQGHALPRDAYVHRLGFHRRRTPEGRALGSGILQAHQSTLGSQRVRPAGSAKKASRVPQKYRWARESGCGKRLSKFADRPTKDVSTGRVGRLTSSAPSVKSGPFWTNARGAYGTRGSRLATPILGSAIRTRR